MVSSLTNFDMETECVFPFFICFDAVRIILGGVSQISAYPSRSCDRGANDLL